MASTSTSPLAVPARLVQLQGFLSQDPDNLDLLAEVIRLALESGHPHLAEAALAALSPKAANEPLAVHLRSEALLAGGRYAESVDVLRRLATDGALVPASRFNLAYGLARQDLHREAIGELQALMAGAGTPPATLAWLMRSVRQADGLQAALAEWDRAPASARSPEACGVASLLYFDANQLPVARTLSSQAIAAGIHSSEALVTEAGAAILENRPTDAVSLVQKALDRNALDGRLWSMLGIARMRASDVPAAQAAFRKAVELSPSHIGTWHAFAWSQIVSGDLDGAALSFERALALDRNFGETHGGLAVVAALQGRRDEAEAAIARAVRLDAAGLSPRYAQALLSGEASDMQSLRRLAARLLGARPAPLGGSIYSLVFPDDEPR